MKVILLNKDQADKVRGRHGKYSALDPVLTNDNRFILPVEVLNDPEHKEVISDLGECKFAEIEETQEINTKIPLEDALRYKQIISVKSVNELTISKVSAIKK